MAELDPFELRLTRAIRSVADRADTRVDAIAVATEAIGRRRPRPAILAWRRLPAPALILLLLALSLALFGLSSMIGAMRDRSMLVVPPPTQPALATGALAPTATPLPSDGGRGARNVAGTGSFAIVDPGTTVRGGDGTQVRGFVATSTDAMSDPRASGTGTLRLSIDTFGAVGREWGTYQLATAKGAWLGSVSGAAWGDGNESDVAGYLVGSGVYAGLTYYIHVRSTSFSTDIDGIIYPGSPPGP